MSRPARLLTLEDLSGYQCPDGAKLVVQRCRDESDDASCAVVQAHLPPRNGYQITTDERRADVTRRVSACRPGRVFVNDQSMVVFAP
jgi:hypothetical protein